MPVPSNNRLYLRLKDGTEISIVTGPYAYCEPRDDKGPYTHVEIGLWSYPTADLHNYQELPDEHYEESNSLRVFPYVPVEVLARFLLIRETE